jgi:transitional endoplasmic reticulum ATPase
LDPKMKDDLTSVAEKFFDSKEIYEGLGVPWKRGLLFHGPPGNGKTVSIKALMHTLAHRDRPIPTLYVRSAPSTYTIGRIFSFARTMAPCMLVLEDIETIVRETTRSYFFNEVDGLENNGGILMVASTNFLNKLDPGLTSRPSRFDRKYLFRLPNEHERVLYADYWRRKLKNNDKVDFPEKLCGSIAKITDGFSFAYMQEAFVASLLEIARLGSQQSSRLSFWKIFEEQVRILRRDMKSQLLGLDQSKISRPDTACEEYYPSGFEGDKTSQLQRTMALRDVGPPYRGYRSGRAEGDVAQVSDCFVDEAWLFGRDNGHCSSEHLHRIREPTS